MTVLPALPAALTFRDYAEGNDPSLAAMLPMVAAFLKGAMNVTSHLGAVSRASVMAFVRNSPLYLLLARAVSDLCSSSVHIGTEIFQARIHQQRGNSRIWSQSVSESDGADDIGS